ncbi:MAG: acyl-CoA reductase [Bacteroidota bacterium]
MNLKDRIQAFSLLGDKINQLTQEEIRNFAKQAKNENPWFTEENVKMALEGIGFMLQGHKLTQWLKVYDLNVEVPKIVGIVMAGNIPLVGFHDLMSVLLTGHYAAVKTSSKDTFLVRLIIGWLLELAPGLKKNISFRERLTEIDAVIATGSDNTARYFHYYFDKIPNIIRKNRVSVAIIDGSETREEFEALGLDIFSYYGMGCRNVSKVFYPKGFDPTQIFESFELFKQVSDNHKYQNNYDYHKSIFLINKIPHLDTGFLLWQETDELVSPLSVIYSEAYSTKSNLQQRLQHLESKIQCVVGHEFIPFGKAQFPEPWDYADNVDTIKFLSTI